MKTIKLVAVVCLAYSASACELDQTEIIPNDDSLEINKDYNIIQSILDDSLTKEYFNSLNGVFETRELKKGNLDVRNLRATDFNSLEEFEGYIFDNFENPEEIYQKIHNSASLGQEIRKKYPEIDNLNQKEFNTLLNQMLMSFKNSKSDNARMGPCEANLDNSEDTCRDTALLEAAGCGLLSPTLLLALGCGGIFI